MGNLQVKTANLIESSEIREEQDLRESKVFKDIVKQYQLFLKFTIKKMEACFLLEGNIEGSLTIECARCLEDYKFPVNLDFCRDYPLSTEEIDVEDEVKQLILLNIPLKPLCKEECSGLCVKCGKNKNIEKCSCVIDTKDLRTDIRWEKLKDKIKK
jgi:uncharacterized protein